MEYSEPWASELGELVVPLVQPLPFPSQSAIRAGELGELVAPLASLFTFLLYFFVLPSSRC